MGDSKGWLAELESSPFGIVRIEDIGGSDGRIAKCVSVVEECPWFPGGGGW